MVTVAVLAVVAVVEVVAVVVSGVIAVGLRLGVSSSRC
jgi:hypothetical protein